MIHITFYTWLTAICAEIRHSCRHLVCNAFRSAQMDFFGSDSSFGTNKWFSLANKNFRPPKSILVFLLHSIWLQGYLKQGITVISFVTLFSATRWPFFKRIAVSIQSNENLWPIRISKSYLQFWSLPGPRFDSKGSEIAIWSKYSPPSFPSSDVFFGSDGEFR